MVNGYRCVPYLPYLPYLLSYKVQERALGEEWGL